MVAPSTLYIFTRIYLEFIKVYLTFIDFIALSYFSPCSRISKTIKIFIIFNHSHIIYRFYPIFISSYGISNQTDNQINDLNECETDKDKIMNIFLNNISKNQEYISRSKNRSTTRKRLNTVITIYRKIIT